MLEFVDIHCPACGEPQSLGVDASAGGQGYIEDCQVCCRPMQVHVDVGEAGEVAVQVRGDDDA